MQGMSQKENTGRKKHIDLNGAIEYYKHVFQTTLINLSVSRKIL